MSELSIASSPSAPPVSRAFIADLSKLFPASRLLVGPAALAAYESDALTAFKEHPAAIVLAETRDEVIETVRLCHRHRVPFVARGSGTSLSGGSLPIGDGIVIALNRMNRILRLDPRERIAVVEPGVVNLNVSRAAAPHGLYYAPDPSSQPVCTIGGNIAFNSGGAHCLKYGMTSNHVLGMEVVLPDGEVVRLGGESLEMMGPDLTGLFVGSEGLFGIATEVTLRLLPLPEAYRTVLASYDSLEAAGDAVSAIVAAGILPGAMEIMDRLAIRAAEVGARAGYPPDAAALLIVELEGEEKTVEAEFAALLDVIRASGARETRLAADADERARIWKGRKAAFSAVGRLAPDYIVQDGVVPRSRLGEALARIDRMSQEAGIPVANVFHAGDGNLHPLILFDGRVEGALERAEALAGRILEMCIELGGSITGEHGVGMEKRAYMPLLFGQAEMETMERLRESIDPLALANRGKMLGGSAAAPDSRRGAEHAEESAEQVRIAALTPIGHGGDASDQPKDARPSTVERPRTPEEVAELVRAHARVVVRGGGTKPRLSRTPPGAVCIDLSALSGVIRYDPDEFTFTARAGTPLVEVMEMLSRHDQYLPFDPPLAEAGATLGGTVAAGLSGSGRFRYGGVRDFIIGVRFVDGRGEAVRGGGAVVKNAAGFDFPKLMVGALGRLGVLTEITFKVFPAPLAMASARADFETLAEALEAMADLAGSQLDLDAIDLVPGGEAASLWLRVAGPERILPSRLARIRDMLASHYRLAGFAIGEPEIRRFREVDAKATDYWTGMSGFRWRPVGQTLVKVSVTPERIRRLDPELAARGATRRYAAGGAIAWIAWPDPVGELDAILRSQGLGGLCIDGDSPRPWLGTLPGRAFLDRIAAALDPAGKFGGFADYPG